MLLTSIDYPALGIEDPNWRRYSPDEPKAWHAFWLQTGDGPGQGIFLGEGDTDLNTVPLSVTDAEVLCIKGFPYVIFASGSVLAIPCNNLGYSQFVEIGDMLIFCNYAELAVVRRNGEVRYSGDLALDDLIVLSASSDSLNLSGLKEYGSESEAFFVNVRDLPVVTESYISNSFGRDGQYET